MNNKNSVRSESSRYWHHLFLGLSLIFFCGAVFFALQNIASINKSAGYGDMAIFVNATQNFLNGNHLYFRSDNVVEYYAPGTAVFKFPPGFQLTLLPFVANGIEDSFFKHTRIVFSWLYVAAIFFMCLHCVRLFWAKSYGNFYGVSLVFFVGGIAMFFEMFRHALWLMAIEIPILFLLVAVFLLSPRYRFLSGCLLAYVFLLKIYPVFMGAYFLIVRNFVAVIGFIFGVAALLLLSIIFLGYEDVAYYFLDILPVLAREPVVLHAQNVSFLSFMTESGAGAFTNAFRSMILLSVLLLIMRRCEKIYLPLVFSFVMLSMLLTINNYWPQYFMFCILPLCVLFIYCCVFRWRLIGTLCLISAGIFCLTIENVFDTIPFLLGFSSLSTMALEPHIAQEIDQAGIWRFLLERNYLAFLLYAGLSVKAIVPFVLWCCILVVIWKKSCWSFDFKSPDLNETGPSR